MNKQIESLLVEREGYVRRGLKDRVKAVDESLRELGYEAKYVETASVESDERAVSPKVVRKRKV